MTKTNETAAARTTTVRGFVLDFENMTAPTPFEVKVPYTRTLTTAQTSVADMMDKPVNTIAVAELVQPERNDVDDKAIVKAAQSISDTEPENVPDGFTVVPVCEFLYDGAAFGFDENGEPVGVRIQEHSFEKLTKGTAASVLEANAQANFNGNGWAFYTVCYRGRHSVKRYALIDSKTYHAMRYSF